MTEPIWPALVITWILRNTPNQNVREPQRGWGSSSVEVHFIWLGGGSVGRCQVLQDNEFSISIKRQQKEAWNAPKHPGDGCVDFGLDKTQSTPMSSPEDDMAPQIITDHTDHTGLQAAWNLCLSILHSETWTLISKGNERQTTSLSLSKTLLTLSLVRYNEFGESCTSSCPGSVCVQMLLMHCLLPQSTPCVAPTHF